MKRMSFLCAGLLILVACNQNKKGNEEKYVPVLETSEITDQQVPDNHNANVFITFADNSTSATLDQSINGMTDYKTYTFQAEKGQKLVVKIQPEKTPVNIRIKQIVSPSGKMDGPFGLEVRYDIIESGQWKFVVDESNMIGEQFRGKFKLEITLK